jgi:hypothetical protein
VENQRQSYQHYDADPTDGFSTLHLDKFFPPEKVYRAA